MCATEFDTEIRARIKACETFSAALGVLADVVARIGFPKVAYGYVPTVPRQEDGRWRPMKLNTQNFPQNWDQGWAPFMAVDPYYRKCCCSLKPIEWDDIRGSTNLTRAQEEAISYLDSLGLSNGISIPMHLPFGHFA